MGNYLRQGKYLSPVGIHWGGLACAVEPKIPAMAKRARSVLATWLCFLFMWEPPKVFEGRAFGFSR